MLFMIIKTFKIYVSLQIEILEKAPEPNISH